MRARCFELVALVPRDDLTVQDQLYNGYIFIEETGKLLA